MARHRDKNVASPLKNCPFSNLIYINFDDDHWLLFKGCVHSVKTEKLCIIDILTNDSKVKKTRSIKSSIILEILAFHLLLDCLIVVSP